MAWYDAQNMGSAFPLLDYGTQTIARNVNNALPNNRNNSGLQWWMNADRGRWPVSGTNVMPDNLTQDLGAATYRGPLPSVVDESRIPGRIQEELPTKKGFSFNPLNWGIMGMAKKMIEPNTPEENFGRNYFNMSSSGRALGNMAENVFAGKNVASAFGQGMGGAAQKRIDTIGNTIQRLTEDDEEKNRALISRLQNKQNIFQTQLAQYNKDLAGATGGADTTVTNVTQAGDGGQGYHPTTRAQNVARTASRVGPGGNVRAYGLAQGGRIGYALGTPDPDEPPEDIFEVMQDQNIPFGEQVQGDPFDLRIQELMGKGLSYDDAYDIAEMEFQDLFAEGPDQDQGLASLV